MRKQDTGQAVTSLPCPDESAIVTSHGHTERTIQDATDDTNSVSQNTLIFLPQNST